GAGRGAGPRRGRPLDADPLDAGRRGGGTGVTRRAAGRGFPGGHRL
ncbi:MAG: hypothetical protein AVDCRST_MAG35-688, partial [uncultured Quadrisphaera sp.]